MGQSNWPNPFVIARRVAEILFPQRPELGLDQRDCSAAVIDKIVSANAEHKSSAKAQRMQIMDLTARIGQELQDHLAQQAEAHANERLQPKYREAPKVVSVSADRGRILAEIDALLAR